MPDDERNFFGLRLTPPAMLFLGIMAGATGGKGWDIVYPPAPDRFTGEQAVRLEAELREEIADAQKDSAARDARQQALIESNATELRVHDRWARSKESEMNSRQTGIESRQQAMQRRIERLERALERGNNGGGRTP